MNNTMKLMERVAYAICETEYDGGHLSGSEVMACVAEDMANPARRKWLDRLARAAIEAAGIESLQARVKCLEEALGAVEPYLDAIICYASTTSEHDGNLVAAQVRTTLANQGGEKTPSPKEE